MARGNLDYDQTRDSARQGDGSQFQMFGGGSVVTNAPLLYDARGNAISGAVAQLVPTLPADASKFLNGTGAFSTPPGTGTNAFPYSGLIYPPLIGSLTWINQTGTTPNASYDTSNANAAVMRLFENASLNNAWLVQAAPATPYTKTMRFNVLTSTAVASTAFGLIFRQSSSGKVVSIEVLINTTGVSYRVQQWNSPTSAGSAVLAAVRLGGLFAPYISLRIQDDGSNRKYYISVDGGIFFFLGFTETRTTFITADQVGFGGVCNTTVAGNSIIASILDFS